MKEMKRRYTPSFAQINKRKQRLEMVRRKKEAYLQQEAELEEQIRQDEQMLLADAVFSRGITLEEAIRLLGSEKNTAAHISEKNIKEEKVHEPVQKLGE